MTDTKRTDDEILNGFLNTGDTTPVGQAMAALIRRTNELRVGIKDVREHLHTTR